MCQTLSSKGPFLLPPDEQLQYQSTCYPAICGPPFTSHCVRANFRSVWFIYFFSRSKHVAVLVSHGCDCPATASDLWLLLVLTPLACFEFLLNTMLCRRSSEFFLSACWGLMAHGKCLLSSLLCLVFFTCCGKWRSGWLFSHSVSKPISGSQTGITLPAFHMCLFVLPYRSHCCSWLVMFSYLQRSEMKMLESWENLISAKPLLDVLLFGIFFLWGNLGEACSAQSFVHGHECILWRGPGIVK